MSATVSANEAAQRFGLSEKTVRRWIAAGKLKADKGGRAYRVSLSEVAALIGQDTAHNGGPAADTVADMPYSLRPGRCRRERQRGPEWADERPRGGGTLQAVMSPWRT